MKSLQLIVAFIALSVASAIPLGAGSDKSLEKSFKRDSMS